MGFRFNVQFLFESFYQKIVTFDTHSHTRSLSYFLLFAKKYMSHDAQKCQCVISL